MGRRKKQADIEDAIKDQPLKNSGLTEDEKRALHYRHCREYEVALGAKKKADAEIKNVGKRIKAEDDSVAKVKKTILARSPEGESQLKAEMAETAQVLRWSGTNVGETAELFPEDRRPGEDRAHAEGKRIGLEGGPCNNPHDPSVPQFAAWMAGWQDGQGILASAFQKAPTAPVEAELDPADVSDPPFAAPPENMPAAPAMPQ
jgi:hypothetical protein